MKLFPILIAATCIAGPTSAFSAACPMTYVQFQAAIPHIDLDDCPSELAGKDRFCRATIASEQVHVYAFDFEGDKCLLGVKSFEEGRYSLQIKKAK